MSKWIWTVVAGAIGAAVLLVAADIAYREFYIKPLGVAYLVEQFPEIVSTSDIATASPEVMILDHTAFDSNCADSTWGCYSAEAYRRVKRVYVWRQHGGFNEVIPCDPGGCPDGRDYQIKELTAEESESVGRQSDRDDLVDECHSKVVSSYEIKVCRQDFLFDGDVERSYFALSIPQQILIRPLVDSLPGPEIAFDFNRVSGHKRLEGGAAELLKERM